MGQKFIKLSNFRRRQTVCGYILVGVSFLLLSLLTVKIFAPQVETDAASQTASQTVGPYSLSMANDSVATINITPTASQAVYTASNNLSVTNTCTSGATITMTVNSTTSNALTRSATNSDTLTKTIAATSGSSLVDNSWGYSKNNGTNYYAVPLKNATPATIYDASAAQTSALSVPVLFGVKTDNNLPSGNYTNTVVYTMTPKSGCLTYSITWDMDGGTKKSGATYPTSKGWGETVNLSQLTPTKSGYTFDGWTNGSSTFTGSEAAANLNSSNAKTVTVKAKWTSNCSFSSKSFSYTGSVQSWTVPSGCEGIYKFEVWGAWGGSASSNSFYRTEGGHGAYVSGNLSIPTITTFYIHIGEEGSLNSDNNYSYGGGGYRVGSSASTYGKKGGGATDIRLKSGTWNNSNGLLSRIIVAGGGAGAAHNNSDDDSDSITRRTCGNANTYAKAMAAGGEDSSFGCYPATQNSAGAGGSFGFGANDNWQYGTNLWGSPDSSGGGGWYGGGAGGDNDYQFSSGGSSYILTNSSYKPSGYTPTSIYYFSNITMKSGADSFKSPSGSYETGHTGNGYARITRQN